MINSSDEFKTTLTSPVSEVYVKLELMDKNENVIDIFTHHVGSDTIGDVSVDGERDIQRMFTLTLNNENKKFTWVENGLIWIDNKSVKLYIGLRVGSEIQYISQGVFVITNPEAIHNTQGNTVSISGQDKWYLLTGNFGRFTHETTIIKGTNIKEAIRILMTGTGITKMILDNCNMTVPYDMTYQIGQNRGEAIKDLAAKAYIEDEYFYNVYFDVNGYFRFEKYKNPLLESPCWTYQVDNKTLYAGSTRKLDDSELFNHIIVMGGSSQVAEFRSEIIIDNTLTEWDNNPYSIQNIGDRLYVWNNGNPDSNIDSQSQCNARALYELKKRLQYIESVSFDLAPNYLHEVNDVIEIIDEENGCIGNYQLKRFSIPIRPKVVSAEAIKVKEVL